MPNRKAVFLKCEAWHWPMPGVGPESATRPPRANGVRTKPARILLAFCWNSSEIQKVDEFSTLSTEFSEIPRIFHQDRCKIRNENCEKC